MFQRGHRAGFERLGCIDLKTRHRGIKHKAQEEDWRRGFGKRPRGRGVGKRAWEGAGGMGKGLGKGSGDDGLGRGWREGEWHSEVVDTDNFFRDCNIKCRLCSQGHIVGLPAARGGAVDFASDVQHAAASLSTAARHVGGPVAHADSLRLEWEAGAPISQVWQ